MARMEARRWNCIRKSRGWNRRMSLTPTTALHFLIPYAECVVVGGDCAYPPSSAEHGERFPLVWEVGGGGL